MAIFFKTGLSYKSCLRETLPYLSRTLSVLFVGLIFFSIYLKRYVLSLDHGSIVASLASMDIWRGVFYGLAPAIFILLFTPRKILAGFRLFQRAVISVAVGFIIGAGPIVGYLFSRDEMPLPAQFFPVSVWLGLNIASLLILVFPKRDDDKNSTILLRRAFFAGDLLLPMAVWRQYAKGGNIFIRIFRIIPATILILPFLYIVLTNPQPLSMAPDIHPSISRIDGYIKNGYGMIVGDQGDLLWISKGNTLSRLEIKNGKIIKEIDSPKFLGSQDEVFVNHAAFDHVGSELLAAGFDGDNKICQLLKLDSETMAVIEEKLFLIEEAGNMGSSNFLWDFKRNILVAAFEGALVRFSSDLNYITAFSHLSYSSDALLDPVRPLIYVCFYTPGMVIAFDVKTLKVEKFILLPQYAQRLAVDPQMDRLFISFPVEGVIRVIDLKKFEVVRDIFATLGIREMHVDARHRVLITGGFSPYMEIYSLDDLKLLDRRIAPSWQREMASSENGEHIYISSQTGLWKMKMDYMPDENRKFIFDPYFLFMRVAIPIAQRYSGFEPTKGQERDVRMCRLRDKIVPPGIKAINIENR